MNGGERKAEGVEGVACLEALEGAEQTGLQNVFLSLVWDLQED